MNNYVPGGKRILVGPMDHPLPMTANLVTALYRSVNTLTLPDMAWPSHIRWNGRIFAIYHETQTVGEIPRSMMYREIEIWDAPT